ncbi:MAG: excinuclease ABC subunit UvrC [Proteobacteria bacterium]|nr:excinuclease ABC subunit UvrC [Pseudomonadota bacterium]
MDGITLITERLKTLPTAPGVYRMLGEGGKVLYVGKAKNLKNRVTSYTKPDRGMSTRIRKMVFETRDLVIVETATEAQALLLEAELIKNLKPYYNIRLRDDKSFPGILLSAHDSPRLKLHRGPVPDGARYFGPYADAAAVHKTIDTLERVFKLRTCSDGFFKARTRPCLKYHIKRCSAPCVARIGHKDYQRTVDEASAFLQGKGDTVLGTIRIRMEEASKAMDYELAAVERDRLKALSALLTNQQAIAEGLDEADVFAMYQSGGHVAVQLFMFRGGSHTGNTAFFPQGLEVEDMAEAMRIFLALHYASRKAPKVVLTNIAPQDKPTLEEALSQQAGRKVKVETPSRGEKHTLVQQALKNAQGALTRKIESGATQSQLLAEFAELLGYDGEIRRIEAFDISNTQGRQPVASMVVADEEGMKKADYRKFSIKGKDTPDDYTMMREALTRRYSRLKEQGAEADWPDVVMVDGGLGHLHVLEEVFKELEIDGPVLTAIAKGPERDKGLEKIFLTGRGAPLDIPFNTPLIFLLQRIRDEAHRFAIGFHRKTRSKALIRSALDEIAGIGPKRKKALLLHFGAVENIRNATVDDLLKVDGLNRKTAELIYHYFNG